MSRTDPVSIRCIGCGHTVSTPGIAACPECGRSLPEQPADELRKQIITRSRMSAGIGVISITIFPLVAPLAIVFGVRTHRACKAQGVHGLPRVFSIGGVILGALTIVAWTFFILVVFLEST